MSIHSHSSKGDHQLLKDHLEQHQETSHAHPKALWVAASNGHAQCVQLLLPFVHNEEIASDFVMDQPIANNTNPGSGYYQYELWRDVVNRSTHPLITSRTYGGQALLMASEGGHLECVKLLIPVADAESIDRALIRCFIENHFLCLKEISAHSSEDVKKVIMMTSAKWGYEQCLKFMVSISEDHDHSPALLVAARNMRRACMDVLIPTSNHQKVINELMAEQHTQELAVLQTRISLYEKKLINNQISSSQQSRRHKKI